jgi:hypothetical protein
MKALETYQIELTFLTETSLTKTAAGKTKFLREIA